jgi:hypothetical protein
VIIKASWDTEATLDCRRHRAGGMARRLIVLLSQHRSELPQRRRMSQV